MDWLNAIILMDAPEDLNERLNFEAEYFIGQDSDMECVKPHEKHLSRVIIGDVAAVSLDRLLKQYGIKFVATKGNREESVLGSYTDTYSIARIHGEKCLDFIFSIIENAGWNKETNGYATFVMRALKEMWVAIRMKGKQSISFYQKGCVLLTLLYLVQSPGLNIQNVTIGWHVMYFRLMQEMFVFLMGLPVF